MRLDWPLAVRWMHDALVEDALDIAESSLTGSPRVPRRYAINVRAVRWLAAAGRKPESDDELTVRRRVAKLTARDIRPRGPLTGDACATVDPAAG